MKKNRLILGSVLGGLIVGLGVWQIFFSAVEVEAIKIEATDFRDTFEEDGKVVVAQEAKVHPSVSGKVKESVAREGQSVQPGDVLVVLDDTEFQYELKRLCGQQIEIKGQRNAEGEKTDIYQIEAQKNTVKLAEAQLNDAKKDFEAYSKLYDSGVLSQNEWEHYNKTKEDAVKNLNIQQALLSSLQSSNQLKVGETAQYSGLEQQVAAQIEWIKYQIEQCVIKAPIAGVVSDFDIKNGELLTPETIVATLFVPQHYSVESYVLSEDVADLKENDAVEITRKRKGEDDHLTGTIEMIAPAAVEKTSALGLEEQRVKVTVALKEDEDLQVRPGDELKVRFTAYSQDACYVLPKESVFDTPQGDAVWVVRQGSVSLQPVKPLYQSGRKAVISDGIRAGEYILDHLKERNIVAGMKVKIKEE